MRIFSAFVSTATAQLSMYGQSAPPAGSPSFNPTQSNSLSSSSSNNNRNGGSGGFGGSSSSNGGSGGFGGSSSSNGDGLSDDERNLKMLRMSVPGIPGQDYPIYSSVPDTGFDCQGRVFGGEDICRLRLFFS